MWQRMKWPGSTSASGGSSVSQIAPILRGQRVLKTQPGRRVGRARGLPCKLDPWPLLPFEGGYGGQQRLRVGMVRWVEDHLRVPELHDSPEVEDGDPVGEEADDSKVVRDEDVGDALVGLQVREEIEDCGLDGGVQG